MTRAPRFRFPSRGRAARSTRSKRGRARSRTLRKQAQKKRSKKKASKKPNARRIKRRASHAPKRQARQRRKRQQRTNRSNRSNRTLKSFPLVAASFSRDGRRLATATEGRVHVWDLAGFRQGRRASLIARITETGAADRIALSPDGKKVAVARTGFPEVQLFDLDKAALLWTARLHAITALAFAPDGGRILAGDVVIRDLLRKGTAHVLDVHSGAILWSSSDVDRPLRDVAFHHDGLLVIGVLGPDGVVVVWDTEGKGELFRFPNRLTPVEIGKRIGCSSAIAPDGNRVAFAYDGRAEVWRVDSGEKIATIEIGGRAQSVALAPDGRTIATGFPTKGRWTLPGGARAGDVKGDGRVMLSPDGDVLLAAKRYTEREGPALQSTRR